MLLTGNITPDRRPQRDHGVGEEASHPRRQESRGCSPTRASTGRVKSVVQPALEAMIGVKQGSEAVLSISGADTTAAQAQLDSFIEKWKTEHVNALILVGSGAPSSKRVRRQGEGGDPRHAARRRHHECRGRRPIRREGRDQAESLRGHHHRRRPDRSRALGDPELHVLQEHLREADRHQDPAAERRGEALERQAEQHLRQRRGRLLVRDDVPGRRAAGRQEPEHHELGEHGQQLRDRSAVP